MACSFSVSVSSGILISAIGNSSGLVPVAGVELLASELLAHVHVTTEKGTLFFQFRRLFESLAYAFCSTWYINIMLT